MTSTLNVDERLEFLRTVAESNIVSPSLRTPQVKKSYRRHKPARQLYSDESKRINGILQHEQELNNEDPKHKRLVARVTYFNINAPPSIKPTKKYCDITGLRALYRSPTNNIRYHNSEIFQFIVKPMAPGVDQEYLKLRGANFVLK